jgi:hypothetical protein
MVEASFLSKIGFRADAGVSGRLDKLTNRPTTNRSAANLVAIRRIIQHTKMR